MSIAATIARAEGYIDLGMFHDAWLVIEDLPSEIKASLAVLQMQLTILIGERSWVHAEILAGSLIQAGGGDGAVWYAMAQAQAQQGKLDGAKQALKRACEMDEGLKARALEDELLERLW